MRRAARLDAAQLAAWCASELGSEPAETLFRAGYLSEVVGLRLADGRGVVVKVRWWEERLIACTQVQRTLFQCGFPTPEPLAGPTRQDGLAINAERLVAGGELLARTPEAADAFAMVLAQLVKSAPKPNEIGSLQPSPAWVGWDHPGRQLWPAPDDRTGDLNRHAGDRWLDELAGLARQKLVASAEELVVGHADWYSQNLRWAGRQVHVVHDWDSVVAQPEAAIAGQAAAIWPGTGQPGEVATVGESERFLAGYERTRGRAWTDAEAEAAWAAGLWTRAFDAKKASLVGDDPEVTLTRSESAVRQRLAGL